MEFYDALDYMNRTCEYHPHATLRVPGLLCSSARDKPARAHGCAVRRGYQVKFDISVLGP